MITRSPNIEETEEILAMIARIQDARPEKDVTWWTVNKIKILILKANETPKETA